MEDISPDRLEMCRLSKEAIILFSKLVVKGELIEFVVIILNGPKLCCWIFCDVALVLDERLMDTWMALCVEHRQREVGPVVWGELELIFGDGLFSAHAKQAEASLCAAAVRLCFVDVSGK